MGSSCTFRVGRELKLEGSEFVSERCWIDHTDKQQVIAETAEKITCSTSTSLKRVKVSSVFPKIVFDRMLSGLKRFENVDKTLQDHILGNKGINEIGSNTSVDILLSQ